ncbi:MAG: hypothetical protein MUE91_03715, partial [Ignavibacteriaceae bacterium]|nr:hypothetical protein [Ignavibacteriaceae bacterium]
KLPNGQEVFDISGEWDAIIENTGVWERYGTFPQLIRITQNGISFTGVRLRDNPPPSSGKAGEECVRGEVEKNGIKKLEWIGAIGQILPSDATFSEGGNKIFIDAYGNVVNKVGSKSLSLLCKENKKSLFVVTSKSKFTKKKIFKPKKEDPQEVWVNKFKNLSVSNIYFEEIENKLITKIFTD